MKPSWKWKIITSFLKKQSQTNFSRQGRIYGIQKKLTVSRTSLPCYRTQTTAVVFLTIHPLFTRQQMQTNLWYTTEVLLHQLAATRSKSKPELWPLFPRFFRLQGTIKLIEENIAQSKQKGK